MKKSFFPYLPYTSIFLLLALVGWGVSSSRAQVSFQNGNQACEAEDVVGTLGIGTQAESIACRNVEAGADFNGDGFVDCAVAVDSFPNTQSPELNISVLINSGNTGPCAPTVDQFDAALDYEMDFGQFTGMGYITVGALGPNPNGGGGFDDMVVAGLNGFTGVDFMVTAFSTATQPNFGAPGSVLADVANAIWQPAGLNQDGNGTFGNIVLPDMALLDCDNDADLDAVLTVNDTLPLADDTLNLNILLNDGTGLQDIAGAGSSFNTNVPGDLCETNAAVAIADFNNDGFDDIAFGLDEGECENVQSIGVCLNNPQNPCDFSNCPASFRVDLFSVYGVVPDQEIFNFRSLAAGDFNDDGNSDVVVSVERNSGAINGVRYFFGNGADTFSSNLPVNLNTLTQGSFAQMITTGCFNNDNVVDAAFTVNQLTTNGPNPPFVGVVVSDGAGGLSSPVLLDFPGTTFDPRGLDAADFDQQGGDDVIALADTGFTAPNPQAFVFLNEIETINANAGADDATGTNTPLTITDANCTVNPVDPSDPARFGFTWTVSPATGAALTNPNTANPTFTATTPGTYTLTLECLLRCDDTDTDDKVIVVAGPTPAPLPGLTQGGCLASLTGEGTEREWKSHLWLLLLPLGFLLMRMGKKATDSD